MSWQFWWAKWGHFAQPYYAQFQYNGYSVGCGPVAWAMAIGWGSQRAFEDDPRWAGRKGLYHQDGGVGTFARAPRSMTEGIRNIIRELNGHLKTFKFPKTSQGATLPRTMAGVRDYLHPRTGTRADVEYSNFGFEKAAARQMIMDEIRYRSSPAVVGIGWLRHYALAYGYAFQERTITHHSRNIFGYGFSWTVTVQDHVVRVNQGWGGGGYGGDWVTTSTWFGGRLRP